MTNPKPHVCSGACPDCGQAFSPFELKRMLVGDGWQRYLGVRLRDGKKTAVTQSEYDPATMEVTGDTTAYDGKCPGCERVFSVAELRRLEVGATGIVS